MNIIMTIIFIFALYWAYIFIINLTLVETTGRIIGTRHFSEKYYLPSKLKGYRIGLWSSSETTYRYEVNQKIYENIKFSNVLIFPKISQEGQNVIVYYNKFIHGYSVLYKCDLKYFVVNLIPFYIIIIIALYYKSRHFKNIKTIELFKNYFGIDKSIYKKYNIK